MISCQALHVLQEYRSAELLSLWLGFLNSSKSELQAAALMGFTKIFDQSDEQYVKNGLLADSSTPLQQQQQQQPPATSVFIIPSKKLPLLLSINDCAFSRSLVSSCTFLLSDLQSADVNNEMEKVCNFKKRIISMISEAKNGFPTIHYLVKIAFQPIPSLRHAAMDFMRAIALQDGGGWGLRTLFHLNEGNNPVDSESWRFLKERTTEVSKEGKDFKFALIKAIDSSAFKNLLGEDINNQLRLMIAQGAYYMPAKMEVEVI
jgi:hypothetical protein